MMKKNQRGFTLMELMVVIVIVAILAAVAVPLYINYVNDARRTEAKGAMGAIITAEQVWYQRNGSYNIGLTPATIQAQLGVDLSDATANWDFSVADNNGVGFVVTAAPKNGRPTQGLGNVTYTFDRQTPTNNGWNP
jgi:type IV pilus assembly protein PilE